MLLGLCMVLKVIIMQKVYLKSSYGILFYLSTLVLFPTLKVMMVKGMCFKYICRMKIKFALRMGI